MVAAAGVPALGGPFILICCEDDGRVCFWPPSSARAAEWDRDLKLSFILTPSSRGLMCCNSSAGETDDLYIIQTES